MSPPWIITFDVMEKVLEGDIDHFHHGIMSDSIFEDPCSFVIGMTGHWS
jgi:hypothetical protein